VDSETRYIIWWKSRCVWLKGGAPNGDPLGAHDYDSRFEAQKYIDSTCCHRDDFEVHELFISYYTRKA
jgi:hypothetical protein